MIEQQPLHKQPSVQHLSIHCHLTKPKLLLPGQIISDPSFTQNPYDSALFTRTQQQNLSPLYAGFTTTIHAITKKTKKQNENVCIVSLLKSTHQYFPVKNDFVIGIIKVRASEHFVVDIGAPLDAILGGLEFDGATKRNKPNLQVGATVFCRVSEYSKYMGARISCLNKGYNTSNNVVNQEEESSKGNDMGELKGGILTFASSHYQSLIQKQVLQKVGKCAKFQVAFGRNGRIWINSGSQFNTNLICNMIGVIESRGPSVGIQIVDKMMSLVK